MSRNINVKAPLNRAEKIKVSFGVAALGAAATAAAVGIVKEATDKPDTHPEKVTIVYGPGDTMWDKANELQQEHGATESTLDLVAEQKAVDPEHDANVQLGQEATIHIDVPNKR